MKCADLSLPFELSSLDHTERLMMLLLLRRGELGNVDTAWLQILYAMLTLPLNRHHGEVSWALVTPGCHRPMCDTMGLRGRCATAAA